MTIRNSLQAASSCTLIAATVLTMLALAGCASGGNPNGDTPASTANNDPGAVPVGNVASNGGNVVTQTGKTVSDLGTQIGTAQVPLIGGTAAQKDLGATVTSAGNAIQTLGTGISNGLGKTGSTPDPVGTTVQNTGNVVTAAGVTVGNGGQTVTDLGAAGSPLAPLNPVTAPAGGSVSALGQVLQGAGGLVTIGTSSGPVQQVTQQTSNAIVPLASQVARGTQQVGSTTMLGTPLANALNTAGGGLGSAGGQIGAASSNPLAADVGNVVGAAGATVASAGGLVNGGSGGGSTNPLAPVTNTLGGGASGSNPLAPVTNALSSAASGNTTTCSPRSRMRWAVSRTPPAVPAAIRCPP